MKHNQKILLQGFKKLVGITGERIKIKIGSTDCVESYLQGQKKTLQELNVHT